MVQTYIKICQIWQHCHMLVSKYCLNGCTPARVIYTYIQAGRAGLKPMQLHWAPRVWGPRAVVFG